MHKNNCILKLLLFLVEIRVNRKALDPEENHRGILKRLKRKPAFKRKRKRKGKKKKPANELRLQCWLMS